MQRLRLAPGLDANETVSGLVLLLYSLVELPAACDVCCYPLELEDNYLAFRNPDPRRRELYVAVKEPAATADTTSIHKLVGLCDSILCLELSQEFQSKIEKLYLKFVPEMYAKHSPSKKWIKRPSLTFINKNYKRSYSREADNIHYCRDPSEVIANRLLSQAFRLGGLDLGLGQGRTSDPAPTLSLSEVISIYENTDFSEKQVAHIKYAVMGYKEMLWAQSMKTQALSKIFELEGGDATKKVLKEVERAGLDSKEVAQLEWKYSRLRRLGVLLEEEKVNYGLVKQYKKMSIFDLEPEVIVLELKEFYRTWLCNTFKELKSSFRLIANRRDTKALNQFKARCTKARQIVEACERVCRSRESEGLVARMKQEINQFIEAHQGVISDELLSVFNFVPFHLRYLWRNEPKIYHKAGVMTLIFVLAWLQSNLIISITLVSLGLIFSAINI